MKYPQAGLNLFGSDLGSSFEHAGRIYVLFGDTYPTRDAVCYLNEPKDDDSLATLPLDFDGTLPRIEFFTEPTAPSEFRPVRLIRNGEHVVLNAFKVPVTGFSDGEHAYAMFQSQTAVRCDRETPCPAQEGVSCASGVLTCEPAPITCPVTCELAEAWCTTRDCTDTTSVCVDTRSPQYDGSTRGIAASVLSILDIARSRSEDPTTFDSVVSWKTNVFSHPTVRTVKRFSGERAGNDFSPGAGSLLIWGRPSMSAEQGRQARVYFATAPLPLDAPGEFQPQYFAGIDPQTEEPRWTADPAQAAPLAMDGQPNGDAFEERSIVGTTSVSWLGAPLNRWVMMYGGDLADFLLADPKGSRSSPAPGAIVMRFAEHPWGPWSPAVPYLQPGSPQHVGDPNGPGGLLYHPDCADSQGARCTRSDAYALTLFGSCVESQFAEPGRLYAPNIIDRYTRPNARGGVDFNFFVSTWNPYSVVLMQGSIDPPAAPPPAGSEPADVGALQRLADWKALPRLGSGSQHVQARGARASNAFVCASGDASLARTPSVPYRFEQPSCAEPYVRGAVLARFEGGGRVVRSWITRQAAAPLRASGREVLRIYVDDAAEPAIEVPLAAAMDGSADEIFAPPFGAGSPQHLAWYYPLAFERKLIVALDRLGELTSYSHELDAVLEAGTAAPPARERLPERDEAVRQLRRVFTPAAGDQAALLPAQSINLAPGQTQAVELTGPATIHELRVRVTDDTALAALGGVRLRVRWDDAAQPAIDAKLLDLLGGSSPPEYSSLALTSVLAGDERTLALKLPMPFAQSAHWELENTGLVRARFELQVTGERTIAGDPAVHLHTQTQTTRSALGPASTHRVASASGRGRLVGVCMQLEGDPLRSVVHAEIDGRRALSDTPIADYADLDDELDGTSAGAVFAQAWGMRPGALTGRLNLCRWHVLGSEVDFDRSLDVGVELGAAG
ncbi:MAG TPA: DUF2961 domain-containing protein, partial [Polyangiales bacterium]|nr:DUF2961 domain-containing protein [Polyangiales bacterium]